jgi:hypothetical protein
MSGLEDKYGLLPEVPEHIMGKLRREAENFANLLKHDPEEAKHFLHREIEWLKENKDFLGRTVETSVDATLGLYSDKLTHKQWIDLQNLLLKGVLFVLHSVNEALKEKLDE